MRYACDDLRSRILIVSSEISHLAANVASPMQRNELNDIRTYAGDTKDLIEVHAKPGSCGRFPVSVRKS